MVARSCYVAVPTQTISRCGGSSTTTYAGTVLTVGGVGTLRAYWRLGEPSGLFADSADWQAAPGAPLLVDGLGSYTRDVPGALPPAQDDGAFEGQVKGNSGGSPFYRLSQFSGTNPLTGLEVGWSVVGWVKPTATVGGDPAFHGSLFNNTTIVAGSPSFEQGWSLDLDWAGGAANPDLILYRTTTIAPSGQVTARIAGLTPGTWYMCSATYDGTTLRVGINGTTFATATDTRFGLGAINGGPVLAWNHAITGQLYGVLDEVALWGTVLTDSALATLFAAA
jgi:hypothetical protein